MHQWCNVLNQFVSSWAIWAEVRLGALARMLHISSVYLNTNYKTSPSNDSQHTFHLFESYRNSLSITNQWTNPKILYFLLWVIVQLCLTCLPRLQVTAKTERIFKLYLIRGRNHLSSNLGVFHKPLGDFQTRIHGSFFSCGFLFYTAMTEALSSFTVVIGGCWPSSPVFYAFVKTASIRWN